MEQENLLDLQKTSSEVKTSKKIHPFLEEIKKNVEVAGFHLGNFGFIPFPTDHPVIVSIQNKLSLGSGFTVIADKPKEITLVKKEATEIKKHKYKISSVDEDQNAVEDIKALYEILHNENTMINYVSSLDDYEADDFGLTNQQLTDFCTQLNLNPQGVLTKIEEQTKILFPNKDYLASKSADLIQVNNNLYLISISGKDQIASGQLSNVKTKLFLISNKQIAEVLTVKKSDTAEILIQLKAKSFSKEEKTTQPSSDIDINLLCQYVEDGMDFKQLEEIINKASTEILNTKNSQGLTVLQLAAKRGDINLVQLLIGKSVKISAQDNDGRTALYYAVMHHPANFKLLKRLAGSSNHLTSNSYDFVNITDNKGYSPLFYAATIPKLEAIPTLIQLGALKRIKIKGKEETSVRNVFVEAITAQKNSENLYKILFALKGPSGLPVSDTILMEVKKVMHQDNLFPLDKKLSLIKLLANSEPAKADEQNDTACAIS